MAIELSAKITERFFCTEEDKQLRFEMTSRAGTFSTKVQNALFARKKAGDPRTDDEPSI
ncbi:MAG: hypothetical protein JKP92_08345 [Alphaproteobacteria bacterium]|nr:hypothetical protein [Alphaproteobacteria bacterium]